MAKITIKDLLDAGVHFGHPTKRWNPKMKSYLYGARNGIYIFDLPKTMRKLQKACQFLYEVTAEGGQVLFVGTKRQAQDAVREVAEEIGMYHMVERWLGGTLTNNQTIRKSIARMKDLQKKEADGVLEGMPKKEAARFRRELGKLQRNLCGIADMNDLPAAMIVVDVDREDIAVNEANRLNIPVVAIVDTNCNPDPVDYVIPGNDDALRSIKIILEAIKTSIESGQGVHQKIREEEEARKKAEAAAAKAKAEKKAAEREAAAAKAKAEKKAEPKAKKKAEPKAKAEKKAEPKKSTAKKTTAKKEDKAEESKADAKEDKPKKSPAKPKAKKEKAEESKADAADAAAAE